MAGIHRFSKENQPAVKGRKKGSKDIKTLLRCEVVLANNNLNPTEEILKLIPKLDPKDQLAAWQFLLKYTQPPLSPTNILLVNNNSQSNLNQMETEELMQEVIDIESRQQS